MIYAATGEEGIGNGYLPRDASTNQRDRNFYTQYIDLRSCSFLQGIARASSLRLPPQQCSCELGIVFARASVQALPLLS